MGLWGYAEWIPMDCYQKVMSINLLGHIRMTKSFLPLIRRDGGGRIVNTSSTLGRAALPLVAAYCVSKAGMEAFSNCLRREVAPLGVAVCLVEPGNYTAATSITTRSGLLPPRTSWQLLDQCVRDDYGESALGHLVDSVEAYQKLSVSCVFRSNFSNFEMISMLDVSGQ